MRTALLLALLVSSIACGADSSTTPTPTTVVGVWSLQSYNGGVLPYTGNLNANGSRDQVTDGLISFDAAGKYVLGISIVRTASTGGITSQNFSEIGSYSGDITGIVLRPNDFSGTGRFGDPPVPATISGTTLTFSQLGKALTFSKK
jgi:hypothetical protein